MEAKFQAIKYLLENGHRNNEWAEAGLLGAVIKVTFDKETDLSKENLDKMIEDAADN